MKPKEIESPKKFDDILLAIGEFGAWQKKLFVFASMIGVMTAMNALGQVFMAADTDHWCRVAQWEKANCTTGQSDDWECLKAKRNASIPRIVTNEETGEMDYDRCHMYDVRKLEFKPGMNAPDYTNKIIDCPNGWVFDTTQYKTTIISEFELVCANQAGASFLQSVYFSGLLFGSIVFGSVADWLGRKPAIYIASLLFLVCGLGNIAAPYAAVYLCFRFFIAAGGMGAFLVAYVLVTEYVGPRKRVLVCISTHFFFATGLTVLPLLAYCFRDWRAIQLWLAAPMVLYFLPYFYMPESARWQVSKGRYRQAETTLRQIAKVNKKDFPEDAFSPQAIKAAREDSNTRGQQTAVGLFRTPNMCAKTLNLMFNWFVNSMVYYGLGLSTSSLGVDDYIAAVISGAIEFPSSIVSIIVLQYVGRRTVLSGTMLIAGTACVISAFLEMGIARAAIAMIGKFFISASFNCVFVVSGEIYPTPVRSAGMGISSTASRIAGILSPFMLELRSVWEPLPYILFGCFSIAAGSLALLLPETKDMILPETLEEGEAFGKRSCCGGVRVTDDAIDMVTIQPIKEEEDVNNVVEDAKQY